MQTGSDASENGARRGRRETYSPNARQHSVAHLTALLIADIQPCRHHKEHLTRCGAGVLKMSVKLQIAVSSVRGNIPTDGLLRDRIASAMRYVRTHEDDIFCMSHRVTDDDRIRTALAAVMLDATEADKDIIVRSLKPLQALGAAMQGIPVDMSQVEMADDLLPIVELWRQSGDPVDTGEKEA
jgi:hypothetical protein